MRARVLECCTVAGDVKLEALRSLWDAAVKLVVAALAGRATIRRTPRSWCLAALLDMFRSLGFTVFRAGDQVGLEYRGGGRQRVYLSVDCGLHYAAMGLAVASRYLRPPQQLVMRARSEYMLHANIRVLIELAAALGLRAWPGGSLSRLVIVEPTSPKPMQAPVRLTTRYAYAIAAALLAAASYGGTVYNSYGIASTNLLGARRLATVLRVLAHLGVVGSTGENLVRLKNLETLEGDLEVEGGYTETLTLLSLLASCKAVTGMEVRGLPPREHPDASDFLYLTKIMGYRHIMECSEGKCNITLERREAKTLTATYTIYDQPDLLYPLAAYTAVTGQATISGLKSFDAEQPASKILEATLQKLAFEAYLEEDNDRLVVLGRSETLEQPAQARPSACPANTAACLLILANNLTRCRGAVEGVEVVENQQPGLLEAILQAGLPVDIA